MRKTLLVAVFLAAFSTIVSGQLTLGIIGGINNASLTARNYENIPDSNRAHFSATNKLRVGIFTFIRLNKYFSIRPEIAFSSKGAKQTLDSTLDQMFAPPGWRDSYKTKSDLTLNYIEIPVLFRFSATLATFGKNKEESRQRALSVELLAGPYASIIASSFSENKVTHKRSSATDSSAQYNFIKTHTASEKVSGIHRVDYGAVFGLGIKVRLVDKVYLYAESRYTISNTDINNGYWTNSRFNSSTLKKETLLPTITHTNTFTLSLGIVANINPKRLKPIGRPDREY